MTIEPQRPENETNTSIATIGEETVALTRRHSDITKRLTRKQTARRIDALMAMTASSSVVKNADKAADEAAV